MHHNSVRFKELTVTYPRSMKCKILILHLYWKKGKLYRKLKILRGSSKSMWSKQLGVIFPHVPLIQLLNKHTNIQQTLKLQVKTTIQFTVIFIMCHYSNGQFQSYIHLKNTTQTTWYKIKIVTGIKVWCSFFFFFFLEWSVFHFIQCRMVQLVNDEM